MTSYTSHLGYVKSTRWNRQEINDFTLYFINFTSFTPLGVCEAVKAV
jgi:hypothetical protein